MRILFATTRGAGHARPLLPLAHACRRAGHDVLVAGPADVAPLIERAPLPFRAVGAPAAAAVEAAWAPVWSRATSPGPEYVVHELFVGLHARAALPGMLAAVEDFDADLVVRETLEFASNVAAERLGVPEVQFGIHLGRVGTRRRCRSPRRRSRRCARRRASPPASPPAGRCSRSPRRRWPPMRRPAYGASAIPPPRRPARPATCR